MTAFDELRHCPDVATLKAALRTRCEKFGLVQRLDVLAAFYEGTRQAVCFLRLDSPEKEQALMQTLGVARFDGEIVFVVDLAQAEQGGGAGPEEPLLQSGIARARGDFRQPRPLGAA